MSELLHIDLSALVQALGLFGVIAIIYAESGLLIGFFLPGDSLLFTAGLLASQGYLDIIPLIVGTGLAAALGDSTGYWFGSVIGPRIFTREDSLLFKKSYVARTKQFFEKHGSKTIFFARFIPIVRTFAPILAGVGKMNYKTFLMYNLIGALVWGVGIPLIGYTVGQLIPNADKYLLPIATVIILTSFLPPAYDYLKERRSRRAQKNSIG